ncbi:hypothetical protein CLOM_g1349 [Closterium sp. NIES-68]|nr:hypothetical protein CLOM_g1349 [Closterium sp. NIES-68]
MTSLTAGASAVRVPLPCAPSAACHKIASARFGIAPWLVVGPRLKGGAHCFHSLKATARVPVSAAGGYSLTESSEDHSGGSGSTMASLTLGEEVPNLEFDSTAGRMKLHEFIGDSWAVVFSHPGDFTPVCTTELGKIALRNGEFEQRGVKLIGLSCDSVEDHVAWIKDIEAYTPGAKVSYPIIADPSRDLAQKLNMLDPDLKDSNGRPLTSRALHILGPDKRLKLSFLYPGSVGRNFDEVLRAIDALQLAADRQVATPSDWKKGDKVVVPPSLSEGEAAKKFPGHETVELPSGKKYLRFTDLK